MTGRIEGNPDFAESLPLAATQDRKRAMNQAQIARLSSRILQHIGTSAFEERALDHVRRACGVDKAAMMYHGHSDRDSRILLAPFLTDAERLTYQREFMGLNPMVAPSRTLPIGRATSSLRFVPLREYRRHPYYDWAKSTFSPIEFAVVVSRSAADAVLMTFARKEGSGDATSRQLRTLEACVGPFRRAHLLHRRLQVGSERAPHSDETLLDLVDTHHACVALSEQMTIIDVNANADAMLVDATVIHRVAGALEFRDPGAQRTFASALRSQPHGSTLALVTGDGARIRTTIIDARGLHGPTSRTGHARWLVILTLPEATLVERRVREFAIEHGLTYTEEQVVRSLVSGRDAEETAMALDQSLATTRSHIKRVFQKSGIHRLPLLCSRVLLRAPA